MAYDFKAIDVVANLLTPEVVQSRPAWSREFHKGKIKVKDDTVNGVTVEEMVERMDRAGIDIALVPAVKLGIDGYKHHWRLDYKEVYKLMERYPGRFYGLVGIDPYESLKGIKELEILVRDYGFVGAHFYPHWFDMPPDDPKVYPFYMKCAELGVPFSLQVGHCLRYSQERRTKSTGRPIALDNVANDIPEVNIIGLHTGYPWITEMISVAWKNPNVYIAIDAYAPKYMPHELFHFANSWGKEKVLFGTDFPVIDFERARREVEELGFREESKRLLLRENALRLFKFS